MRLSRYLVPLMAAGLLVGCGGGKDAASTEPTATKPATFTAKGTLTLIYGARFVDEAHTECAGDSGYDDIIRGAQVVVLDGAGKKIALGQLGPGREVGKTYACRFRFAVADVPAGGGIYSVEVTHRGGYDFKESDAGSLALSLGSPP